MKGLTATAAAAAAAGAQDGPADEECSRLRQPLLLAANKHTNETRNTTTELLSSSSSATTCISSFAGFDGYVCVCRNTLRLAVLVAIDGSPLHQTPTLYQGWAREWNAERAKAAAAASIAVPSNFGKLMLFWFLVVLAGLPMGFSLGCYLTHDTAPECGHSHFLAAFMCMLGGSIVGWQRSSARSKAGSVATRRHELIRERLQRFLDRGNNEGENAHDDTSVFKQYRLEYRQARPSKQTTLQHDYLLFVRREKVQQSDKDDGNGKP